MNVWTNFHAHSYSSCRDICTKEVLIRLTIHRAMPLAWLKMCPHFLIRANYASEPRLDWQEKHQNIFVPSSRNMDRCPLSKRTMVAWCCQQPYVDDSAQAAVSCRYGTLRSAAASTMHLTFCLRLSHFSNPLFPHFLFSTCMVHMCIAWGGLCIWEYPINWQGGGNFYNNTASEKYTHYSWLQMCTFG